MEILVKNPRMRGCNKTHFLKTLKGEETQDKQQNNKDLPGCARNADFNTTLNSKADSLTNGNSLLGEGDEEDEDADDDVEEDDRHEGLGCNKHLESNEGHQECNCENGDEVGNVDTRNDHHLLSSSLEAEQRLLKEMGWKEDGSDDDSYAPLTEDELKEFRDLALKMAEKKTILHVPTPGSNISSLQGLHQSKLNWSPKRIPPFAPLILPPNEDEGSWSSTSDSD